MIWPRGTARAWAAEDLGRYNEKLETRNKTQNHQLSRSDLEGLLVFTLTDLQGPAYALNQKPETRNLDQGTRNQEPGTRNLHLTNKQAQTSAQETN